MILNALAVSFFWLSFIVVGLATLSIVEKKWIHRSADKDYLVRVFIGVCLGFFLYIPILLVGYLTSADVIITSVAWLTFFLMGLVILVRHKELKKLVFQLKSDKWGWFLVAVLAIDYVVSLKVGSHLSGDAIGHIARIRDIATNGFTINDPNYPMLLDSRGMVSLFHGVYATGANIVRLDALDFWFYSLGFFRAAMALGVYSVLKVLFKQKHLASLISAATLIALSYDWRYILYPNQSVHLWLFALTISLIRILGNHKDVLGRILFVASISLASLSHPVFATGMIFLTTVTFGVYVLLRDGGSVYKRIAESIKEYWWYLVAVPVLGLTTIAGALLPVRGVRGRGEPHEVLSLGSIDVLNPLGHYEGLYFTALIILLLCVYSQKRSKALTSVVVGAIITFPILAFTPVFDVLYIFLSPTIVERYRHHTNFLYMVATATSAIILGAYLLLGKIQSVRRYSRVTLVVASIVATAYFGVAPFKKFFTNQSARNSTAYQELRKLERQAPRGLSKEDVVVSAQDTNYRIPAISNASAVKVPNGHAPPSADSFAREECLNQLMSQDTDIRYRALATLRPEYYVSDSQTKHILDFQELEKIEQSSEKYQWLKVNYEIVDSEIREQSAECSLLAKGEA